MEHKPHLPSQPLHLHCRSAATGVSSGLESPRSYPRLHLILCILFIVPLCVEAWATALLLPQTLLCTLPGGRVDRPQQQTDDRFLPYCRINVLESSTLMQPICTAKEVTPERVQQIVAEFNHLLTYVPLTNTVFATMPKAGSTTFWRTMYIGMTGTPWRKPECGVVQNHSSHCWRPYVRNVRDLGADEQFRVLTGDDTLRVAIQRDPLARLMSAFRNKIACHVGAELDAAHNQTHRLRKHANLPAGAGCMNVSEYAEAVDRIRTRIGREGYVQCWQKVDRHFVPQNYHDDVIFYHKVLDVADLSNKSKLHPLLEQLPFADLAKNAGLHGVKSSNVEIFVDDDSSQKLLRFAQLAVIVPPKEGWWN